MSMEPIGIVDDLVTRRDAILSGARVSPEARARILGGRRYTLPVGKTHHITVDLKAGTRTVVTTEPKAAPPPSPIIIPITLRSQRKRMYGFNFDQRVRDVVETACEVFDVDPWEMMSADRHQRISRARHTAFSILKKVLRLSLPSIGRVFKRDHTSCLSGFRRSAFLRTTNAHYRHQYRTVMRRLREKWAVDAEAAP